jgi:IS30 family transposase
MKLRFKFHTVHIANCPCLNSLKIYCPEKSSLQENKVITITTDNSGEFAYHEITSKNLEASYYYARPYASWEQEINENTNGLVRQYLKKGSSFSKVNDNLLISLMDRLNSRPRKS